MVLLSNNLKEAKRQIRHRRLLEKSTDSALSPTGKYDMDDVLHITPEVAEAWKFSWADEADVLRALDNCGMRVDAIFAELARRTAGRALSDEEGALAIVDILRVKFRQCLLSVAPYKATQEDYEL